MDQVPATAAIVLAPVRPLPADSVTATGPLRQRARGGERRRGNRQRARTAAMGLRSTSGGEPESRVDDGHLVSRQTTSGDDLGA